MTKKPSLFAKHIIHKTPKPLVLVTRPQEQAQHFLKELQDYNIPFIHEPLSSLIPIPPPPAPEYEALCFTSSFAVKTFINTYPYDPDMPVFVVGKTTGQYSRKFFKNVRIANESCLFLIDLLKKEAKNRMILYPQAEVTRHNLQLNLAPYGLHIHNLILYKTSTPEKLTDITLNALNEQRITLTTFFSLTASEIFVRLIRHHQLETIITPIEHLAISAEVAEPIKQLSHRITLINQEQCSSEET